MLGEHPLNLGGIGRARQRQHQQHPRLDRREILAGECARCSSGVRGLLAFCAGAGWPAVAPRRGGAIRPLPVLVVVTTNGRPS